MKTLTILLLLFATMCSKEDDNCECVEIETYFTTYYVEACNEEFKQALLEKETSHETWRQFEHDYPCD